MEVHVEKGEDPPSNTEGGAPCLGKRGAGYADLFVGGAVVEEEFVG